MTLPSVAWATMMLSNFFPALDIPPLTPYSLAVPLGQYACHIPVDPDPQCWQDPQWSKELLPPSLHQAAYGRQLQFLAGRHCALQAMQQLQSHHQLPHLEQFPQWHPQLIPIGENRCPQWPFPYWGSITHTAHQAWAVAVQREQGVGIGIDCEEVPTHQRAQKLLEKVFLPAELLHLQKQSTELSTAELFALIFSAKESLFKCLYPQVGRYFWFHDAECVYVNSQTQQLRLCLKKQLHPQWPASQEFCGSFFWQRPYVFTTIWAKYNQ